MNPTPITPDALEGLMRSDAPHALLDMRERATYERGHVYRATSLPRRLLEWRLPLLVTAYSTPIVLYDDDGGRVASLAAETIRGMGYTDVRVLDGGLAAWRASGRRAVQGLNIPSKVFGERMLHEMKTPEITPHELAARIEAGAPMVLIDTRTPEEYHRGCIPGSRSVPGGEVVLRIPELVDRPDIPIVVHCGGRTRSYIGAETIRRMKLPNPIVALENGTMGWELAGLQLERGATRWAPPVSARGRAAASIVAKRVAAEDGVRFIAPADLTSLLGRRERENVYVLDVRTAEEYAAGHVAGAVWAPGGQVVQASDEYVGVRAGTIVLVCDGFVRSVMTAAWLQRMGFPRVAVLAGGLPAWTETGGAVEIGGGTRPPIGIDAARSRVAMIEPKALGAHGGADPVIIDVGQSDAYARGHVPGAAWLCRSRLEMKIADVAPDRARPIVVTCPDGTASTFAAVTLGTLGYANVRVLDGGTAAWERVGLPVERGATRLADVADDVVQKPYDRGREAMEAYLRWEEALDDEGSSPHALLR